jgi:hypothetical protein
MQNPQSFAWSNEPESDLLFALAPRRTPYLMRLRLQGWTMAAAMEHLKLMLNGNALQYSWVDPHNAVAAVSPTWLKDGLNELLLLAPVDTSQGVSLGVDRLEILPQKE